MKGLDRCSRWCLAGLLALCGPTVVSAAGTPLTVTTPVFDRLVSYQLPDGFIPAFENTRDGHYIHENVPRGETVEAWSQMITLTGELGLASDPSRTPEWLAESFRINYSKACPESFAAARIDPPAIGGLPVFAAYLGCGSVGPGNAAHSEAAVILFIRAGTDFYTLQWAERGDAQDAPPTIDADLWKNRLSALTPVSLCPGAADGSC